MFKNLEILHCVQFGLFTSLELLIRTAIRVYECAFKMTDIDIGNRIFVNSLLGNID